MLDWYSFNEVKHVCKFLTVLQQKPSFGATSKMKVDPISIPGVINITIQKRNIREYSMVGGDDHELFSDGLTPLQSIELFLQEQLRLREKRANELRLQRS